MTRKLVEDSLGQHIALSVAAHLARTHLVPDPFKPYDSQHLADTVNIIAGAMAKLIPLYVRDVPATEPRELTAVELEGAMVKRAATVVVLGDGRTLSNVSVKRTDLRQAVAILKAIGTPELRIPPPPEPPPAARIEKPQTLARLAELESLLRLPLIPTYVEKARALATLIARQADHGRIANCAMQLVSALLAAGDSSAAADQLVAVAMARLRASIEDAEKST